MKRLTIDQTWEQCLGMWKWISRRCKKGKTYSRYDNHVDRLKLEWLGLNGVDADEVRDECFLCQYTVPDGNCLRCPAVKVDRDFMCSNVAYDYASKPRLFYAKLKELNKIRLAKK